MNNTTHSQLVHRLSKYGALSAAITGVSLVEGQIGYFNVDPDVGGPNTFYDIRMNEGNGDNTVHFTLSHSAFSSNSSSAFLLINAPVSNSVQGLLSGGFFYLSALDQGQSIGPTAPNSWISDNNVPLSVYNCSYVPPNSQWCGLTEDKYIGLRFKIDDNTHYGWARIRKSETSIGNWLILDHGYNPTPDAPIMAGEQLTLTDRDVAFNKTRIIGLNKSVGLYNTPNSLSYSLFDLTGKNVLSGQLEGSTNVIEANTLSMGIYVLDLIDNETKARLRKKLQL